MQTVVNAEVLKNNNETAILLVAFGTTVKDAWGAFDTLENMVKEEFPDFSVSWAFTSKIVRKRLAERGDFVDSPEEAFLKLSNKGIKNIAIQSLHLIPGIEFDKLSKSIHEEADSLFKNVLLGMPLLNDGEDLEDVKKALLKIIPAERKKEEAVIFMGHGSENHSAGKIYISMNKKLNDIDNKILLATVEGEPSFGEIFKQIEELEVKRCWLIPFMSVAGDHARNDMAGSDDSSWKSILEKNGYYVNPIFKGVGEEREVAQVWVNHLKAVLKNVK